MGILMTCRFHKFSKLQIFQNRRETEVKNQGNFNTQKLVKFLTCLKYWWISQIFPILVTNNIILNEFLKLKIQNIEIFKLFWKSRAKIESFRPLIDACSMFKLNLCIIQGWVMRRWKSYIRIPIGLFYNKAMTAAPRRRYVASTHSRGS